MANTVPHQNFGQLAPPRFDLTIRKLRFDDPEQQTFMDSCGFFAPQAWAEKCFTEFRTAVCARFLARWPVEYTAGLPAEVAMTYSRINSQLKSCIFTRRNIGLLLHWQNMLAVNDEDFANIGETIRRQAVALRATALKATPTLRPQPSKQASDARDLINALTGAAVQPVAVQVPVDPENPEGPMRVVDATRYPPRSLRSTGLIPFVRDIHHLDLVPSSSIDMSSESSFEAEAEGSGSVPQEDGLEYVSEEEYNGDPDYTGDTDEEEEDD